MRLRVSSFTVELPRNATRYRRLRDACQVRNVDRSGFGGHAFDYVPRRIVLPWDRRAC